MIKIQKRWMFLIAMVCASAYVICNLYCPLSEKEQIEEQQTNLENWLLNDHINSSIFQYVGKRTYNSKITGKPVSEFVWSYKENKQEILFALPIIKRRVDISSWKGPSIEGDEELWKELRNREINKRPWKKED